MVSHKAAILFQASIPGDGLTEGSCGGTLGSGPYIWTFHAVSHHYTIFSLMLFPSLEYIHLLSWYHIGVIYGDQDPTEMLPCLQVHPSFLSFFNHFFELHSWPQVALVL